jgi:hypothetical protein
MHHVLIPKLDLLALQPIPVEAFPLLARNHDVIDAQRRDVMEEMGPLGGFDP